MATIRSAGDHVVEQPNGVDLGSGMARHVAIGREVALSVPPDAIRLYA
jgi:hypothetical protein